MNTSLKQRNITPVIACNLGKTWARKNAQDPEYPLNPWNPATNVEMKKQITRDDYNQVFSKTYTFSLKDGRTWADASESD
tara:strand:- start:309 stop:548 length:240 start_codon:yes stop_codon:yes gene_type:complete